MKEKESLKQLLERLDSQSAQFNSHLHQANRLFDEAMKKMESFLTWEKKEMKTTIRKVKDALKKVKKNGGNRES